MFKDYFNFVVPSVLAKKLYETKNKNKNNELVQEMKNGWSNLKDKIKKNIWRWKRNWTNR